MCGLLVSVSRSISEAKFEKALLTMNHRGPDAQATACYPYEGGIVRLGHNRLAIVDVDDRSNQPMSSSCGRYEIVYNGEIYNAVELSDQYLNSCNLQTTSDTEVVLEMFKLFGVEVFSKLSGMYALVILDKSAGQLFVARDGFGIKPLYKYVTESELYFASEIKAFESLGIAPEVDAAQIAVFLQHGFLFEPNCGFTNIEKVLPGTVETYFVNPTPKILQRSKQTYRDVDIPSKPGELFSTSDLSKLVIESISKHLMADVDVCNLWSGGVDSSLIALHAPECRNFTAATDYDLTDAGSDILFVKELEGSTGIVAQEIRLHAYEDASELSLALTESVEVVEELSSDLTIVSILALASAIKNEGYKVVLNGTGADEIFFGYPKYKIFTLWVILKRLKINGLVSALIPKWNNKLVRLRNAMRSHTPERFYQRLSCYFDDLGVEGLLSEKDLVKSLPVQAPISAKRDLEKLLKLERDGFLARNLLLLDKGMMRYSLEGRVPYVTPEIDAAVSSTPVSAHMGLFSTKKILRKMLRNTSLAAVVSRPKRPFHPRFSRAIAAYELSDFTSGCEEKISNFLDLRFVRKEFDNDTRPFHRRQILIMLILWLKRYA